MITTAQHAAHFGEDEPLRRNAQVRTVPRHAEMPQRFLPPPFLHAQPGEGDAAVEGMRSMVREIASEPRQVPRLHQQLLRLRAQGAGIGPLRIGIDEPDDALGTGLLGLAAQINPFHHLCGDGVTAGAHPSEGFLKSAAHGGVDGGAGGVPRHALAPHSGAYGSKVAGRRFAIIRTGPRIRNAGLHPRHRGHDEKKRRHATQGRSGPVQ